MGARRSAVRSLVKGSGVIFLGFVLELGLSFLAKILMAQVLGKTSYGSVSIGIIMAANVSTIFLLGLHTGVARYLPRYDDDPHRRGVLVTAYSVVVPVALATGGLLYLFADPIAARVVRDRAVAPVIRIFGLAVPFAVLMKLAVGTIQGTKHSLPKVYVRNLLQPITRVTLVIAALYLGYRTIGVAWAYFASYVLAALLALYYVWRYTTLFSRARWVPMYRELFRFSMPLAVMSVASLIVSGIGIDTFMIAFFADTADVGEYNVVMPTAKLIIVVFSSFSFLFMPIMSELHAEGATDEMRRLFQVVTKWIVLATLPAFLLMALFPGQVIGLTFGDQYTTAALSLSVLAVGFFVHASVGPAESLLKSAGHTRLITYDNLLAAATNVVLNLLLIPRYSLLGAAVGTTAAYVVLNGLYAAHAYRTLGIHPVTDSLFRPGAVAVVVLGGAYLLATGLFTVGELGIVALVAVVAPVYVAVLLRFGAVESEEVMLVLSFEERFGVDLGPVKRVANRLMG